MKTDKLRKFLIPNIPYVFIGWAFLKLSTAYRLAAGAGFLTKVMGIGQTIGPAFADFAPGLNPVDWLVGIVGAVAFRLFIHMKSKKAKKFRRDEEYGSARCGIPVLCFLLLVQSASFAFYSELFWADQCSLPGRRVGRSSCKECVCIQVSHRHAQQIYDLMAAR